jgi:RNA-directed DNA polymerase
MGRKRQPKQLELSFPNLPRGEAHGRSGRDERTMVTSGYERPTIAERLMEEICEPANLKRALKRVKGNKGSPGVDGMTVDELPSYVWKHWDSLREDLLQGRYGPRPVKRREIPKPGGGVRKLGIPTALDRFVQQAVMQVLQRQWDSTFSEHSYGFRPNRSAHDAVAQAQAYIAEGYGYVVDIDLEKFFDQVNHDMLMGRVAKRIKDKRVLKLIRDFLNAGVLQDGLVSPVTEGTPQGGPLSPLLSNLFLDDLDRELERRGHRFVRYADDQNIYVRSERAGLRVMESLKRFITTKLKLKVNEHKSAVGKPSDRKFLGFRFTAEEVPRRRLAPQSAARFRAKVRELTRRAIGHSLVEVISDLRNYLTGWRGYYDFVEMPWELKKLESWVRRRLRCLIWAQWKTRKKRFKELRRRGVNQGLAKRTAGSSKGPWRISRSQALRVALPNAYFRQLGIPSLTAKGVA